MTTPVGPFTVPAIGQSLQFVTPPGEYRRVVIDNASPYTLEVSIGCPQRWLAAFTSDEYHVEPGANLIVLTPVVELSGVASSSSIVTATFYRHDEHVEGTYPVSLTSQAIVAAISANLSTSLGTFAGTVSTATVSIPAGAWCMQIGLGNAGTATQLQIVGGTTGILYDAYNHAAGRQRSSNIDASLDSTIVITWAGPPGDNWEVCLSPPTRIVEFAHPNQANATAGVALSTTGVTTVINPITYGAIYLFGIDLETAATVTGSPVRLTAQPAGTAPYLASLANLSAQNVTTVDFQNGLFIPLGGGLYVPQRSEAGLTLRVRYAIGVG